MKVEVVQIKSVVTMISASGGLEKHPQFLHCVQVLIDQSQMSGRGVVYGQGSTASGSRTR